MRKAAAAGLDVFGEHPHAAHEIVAVRGQRLAQHFRIGEDEIRRRDRVGDLLNIELGLLARMRIDAFGVLHQFLRPLRGEQIELQHEIEELVRFPLRILEALVARRRLDRGLGRFAGHAARGRAPEIEIGLAHLGLQLGGARVVGEPVFRDHRERLDDLADFAGRLVLRFPAFARLEIGRERLAARLHRLGDVHGEGFGVEGLRSLGFCVDVSSYQGHYSFISCSSPRGLTARGVGLTLLHCDKVCVFTKLHTLQPHRSDLFFGL